MQTHKHHLILMQLVFIIVQLQFFYQPQLHVSRLSIVQRGRPQAGMRTLRRVSFVQYTCTVSTSGSAAMWIRRKHTGAGQLVFVADSMRRCSM